MAKTKPDIVLNVGADATAAFMRIGRCIIDPDEREALEVKAEVCEDLAEQFAEATVAVAVDAGRRIVELETAYYAEVDMHSDAIDAAENAETLAEAALDIAHELMIQRDRESARADAAPSMVLVSQSTLIIEPSEELAAAREAVEVLEDSVAVLTAKLDQTENARRGWRDMYGPIRGYDPDGFSATVDEVLATHGRS